MLVTRPDWIFVHKRNRSPTRMPHLISALFIFEVCPLNLKLTFTFSTLLQSRVQNPLTNCTIWTTIKRIYFSFKHTSIAWFCCHCCSFLGNWRKCLITGFTVFLRTGEETNDSHFKMTARFNDAQSGNKWEGSRPVSYLEKTFILHLLLQWMDSSKIAGGQEQPAKQPKQANSRTCASCQMSRHHRHCCCCCHRSELPAYFWLASALDVIGCSMNGEVKKGPKCCVINLFTCTYSTSHTTTTDSLLSATRTNQGSNAGNTEWIQRQVLGCHRCGASETVWLDNAMYLSADNEGAPPRCKDNAWCMKNISRLSS